MSSEEKSAVDNPRTELKLVLKAESIIQRDAILAALKSANIEAHSAPRDISRKITDTTVDLGMDFVSVTFDGFSIYVDEKDLAEAQKTANSIVKTAMRAKDDPVLARGESMRKFYFCCVFSLMMPFLFHGLAAYHLYYGLKNGERMHWFYGTVSLIIFLGSIAILGHILWTANLEEFFHKLAETL